MHQRLEALTKGLRYLALGLVAAGGLPAIEKQVRKALAALF